LVTTPNTLKVYDASMKYVLLAIFVLFAAQPLQASACDMHDAQDTSHSQHGKMHDNPMDDGGQDMDCCDDDPASPDKGCDSMSHCGACTAGVVALNPSTFNPIFDLNLQQCLLTTGEPLSRFGPPPLRPPIT